MAETVGYIQLFRENRNFRRLFSARLISLFGDWFNTLAVLALLRHLDALSASSFGWVIIFKLLPHLFVSPVAGVVVDRFSRRRIMMATDLIRAGVVLCMLALSYFESVVGLYALVILQSCVATFFEPARNAILPDIVSKEELTAANAIGAAMWSAMLTLGSAAGGLVTAYLGWQVALLVDAGSYGLSLAFLRGIEEPVLKRKKKKTSPTLADLLGIRELVEGVTYMIRRPRVWTLALLKTGWCVAGSVTLILTILGERIYPLGGKAMLGVSVLYVARGLGTGLGPILSRNLSKSEPARMERYILGGFLCAASFYLLFTYTLTLTTSVLPAALLVMFSHFGGATVWVFSSIRLQQLVPTQMRGRVFAAELAGFTLMLSISTWVYGKIIDGAWSWTEAIELHHLPGLVGISLLIPAILWAVRGALLGWGGETPTLEPAEEPG